METVRDFIFLGSKITVDGDCSHEIEGINRMWKTRDLFKKIRDTKGTFHAKMGLIKDRNGMDGKQSWESLGLQEDHTSQS